MKRGIRKQIIRVEVQFHHTGKAGLEMSKAKKKGGGAGAAKLGKSDLTKVKKPRKQNPFEIRFVKEKHQVLNR